MPTAPSPLPVAPGADADDAPTTEAGSEPDQAERRADPRRAARWTAVLVAAAVLTPLVVAAVALRSPTWFPTLDLAMTEVRVRDVGGPDTPLIGLPGRIGTFPDRQGSHPGPLSFYALAPTYRLVGSSSWALQVATLVIHAAAVGAALVLAARRGGARLVVVVGAVVAVLAHGYGIEVLAEPWNPFLPVLAWVVVLLGVWSVLDDDLVALPVTVAAASLCAQTHVPYLALSLGLGVLVVGVLAWRGVRHTEAAARRRIARWGLASAALGVLLWSPVVVDHLRAKPRSNVALLIEHFSDPPEAPVGLGRGIELVLLFLDPRRWSGALGPGDLIDASSDPSGSVVPGVAVLAAWAVAAVVAWRYRHRLLVRLHVVVGASLALAVGSTSRIFGKVWYYLLLSVWAIVALLVFAVAWTVAEAVSRRPTGPGRARTARVGVGLATMVLVLASGSLSVDAVSASHFEERLSSTLAPLVGPTVAALDAGIGAAPGPEGRYHVRWDDALHIGAQGYAMVSELERAGLTAGAGYPWRTPMTEHRVITPEEADATVVFASGPFVERWRRTPGVVEVAAVEPRTDAQLAEFARLRGEVIDQLAAAGLLADLLAVIEGNLFGATFDPRTPPDAAAKLRRMLELGLEAAVFVTAPGIEPVS